MQQFGARRGCGIAGAQPAGYGAGIAFQQVVRIARRQPAAILGDADGHHVEFSAIDRLQDRSRREQRDFVLAAAPAKKNAYAEFFGHFVFIVAHRAGEQTPETNR